MRHWEKQNKTWTITERLGTLKTLPLLFNLLSPRMLSVIFLCWPAAMLASWPARLFPWSGLFWAAVLWTTLRVSWSARISRSSSEAWKRREGSWRPGEEEVLPPPSCYQQGQNDLYMWVMPWMDRNDGWCGRFWRCTLATQILAIEGCSKASYSKKGLHVIMCKDSINSYVLHIHTVKE